MVIGEHVTSLLPSLEEGQSLLIAPHSCDVMQDHESDLFFGEVCVSSYKKYKKIKKETVLSK